MWRCFKGHEAPITKVSMHPGKSMSDNKANTELLQDMS